jgi:protein-tyrosine phosphatase
MDQPRFRCNSVAAGKPPDKEALEGSCMPSVLFVCTANRFRSPLAAAMLKKNLEDLGIAGDWRISSAGTWATPGQPAIPEVFEAAQRFGIDLSGHRSARVSRTLISAYNLILVMQAGQKEALLTEFPHLQERVYLLSYVAERRSYDITDTLGSEQEAPEVIAELDSLIRRGLDSICVLATYLSNNKRISDN